MEKKPAEGEHTVSYCTKCKLDLGHTIVVMTGDKIAKVKCETCGDEHNYRDRSKKKTPVKKAGSTVKKVTSTKSIEQRWEEAMAKAKGSDIGYDMSGAYKVNNIVLHPTFGRGVVQEVFDKKMSIVFQDKERILITSR